MTVGSGAPAAGAAVHVVGDLHQVAGAAISHAWDANAYLLLGDEPTLIDCGGALGFDAVARNVASLGVAVRDIRHVIATHGHWDHVAGAAQLARHGDATLWLHELDRAGVEDGDPDRTSAFLYGEQFPLLHVDEVLHGGERILVGSHTVEVHHTPGHSPGSCCLLIETAGTRVLVAGDTLWGGFHPRIGSDLDAWVASLARIHDLAPDVVLAGHVPGAMFDGTARIEEARRQLGVFFDPWFKPFDERFRY